MRDQWACQAGRLRKYLRNRAAKTRGQGVGKTCSGQRANGFAVTELAWIERFQKIDANLVRAGAGEGAPCAFPSGFLT